MLRKVSDDATKEGYILIKYIVQGGTKLSGSVTISGAKNAAVAILPATLLVSGPCRIENVPDISDAHHIRRGNDIGAGLRLADGRPGQKGQGRVVIDVMAAEFAAMADRKSVV